jgi:hypothetical protein
MPPLYTPDVDRSEVDIDLLTLRREIRRLEKLNPATLDSRLAVTYERAYLEGRRDERRLWKRKLLHALAAVLKEI